MTRAKLVIVEDHPLVAQGLKALLQDEHDVAAIVQDSLKAVAVIRRNDPDVVLLDLSMPKRNGMELLPELRATFPDIRILVVTMHVDRSVADMALGAGADGFVPKESTARELKTAIAAVRAGERYVSPRVPKRMYRAPMASGDPTLDRLTPRQLQILRLLGEGKGGAEIAEILHLSARTVEFHRAGIRRVLGIANEWGLVRYAIVAGLASGNPDAPPPEEPPPDSPAGA